MRSTLYTLSALAVTATASGEAIQQEVPPPIILFPTPILQAGKQQLSRIAAKSQQLVRSVPSRLMARNIRISNRDYNAYLDNDNDNNIMQETSIRETRLASFTDTIKQRLPFLDHDRIDVKSLITPKRIKSTGLYYGLSSNTLQRQVERKAIGGSSIRDNTSQTLDEIRLMRQEMELLRKELQDIRRQLLGYEEEEEETPVQDTQLLQRRQREFDKIAIEIEQWAERLLFEENDEEWTEVSCSKMFKKSLNPNDATTCYLKWLRDERPKDSIFYTDADDNDNHNSDQEYPILKIYSTIDAPFKDVCFFLSRPEYMTTYNELVVKHQDLEDLSPNSKIVWGQTPQILFIKPRDMLTYCSHRWLRDGSQVIVHQACDHHDKAPNAKSKAFALRGANFISHHPEDPNKTCIAMLMHGNPGHDIPSWASKTAVKALTPIEPFKLFAKINESVQKLQPELREKMRAYEPKPLQGRSARPAGIAQLGYACFWPNGGGLKESFVHSHHPSHTDQQSVRSIGNTNSDNADEKASTDGGAFQL